MNAQVKTAPQRRLAGKVALVTGASKGIGAAIARELAAQGASVVVNYASSKADGERVVAEIKTAGGEAVAVGASVATEEGVATLFEGVRTAYGRLDILVNNAGVYTFGPLEAVTRADITKMFDVNVTGLIMSSQAALKLFPAEGGSIINIGSIAGEMAMPNSVVYAGTKGALNIITRVLAKELGPKGIRVNAVNPGATATEGFNAMEGSADFETYMVGATPLGRLGQPNDVATVVAFLASADAQWVSGSLIDAAGGFR
jgi:3-oxoacyl-[acyl-carrier protein] reductase